MAFRLYIVPVIGSGASAADARRAKYFGRNGLVAGNFLAKDYGDDWAFVGADLSGADDVLLVAQPDTYALPFDLSPNLTAPQVANVQAKLESINLPALWVTTAFTWLQVVRIVLGMIHFEQRLVARLSIGRQVPTKLFSGGVTYTTTYSALPQDAKDALQAVAASFKLSTTGITGSTTIRQMLKTIADQFAGRPFIFGGVTL